MRRAAAALALLLACGGEPAPPPAAPVSVRGSLLLEPPVVAVGDVAVAELAVTTPPGHRLRPVRPPESLPGFWLLDAGTPETRSDARRSVHVVRLRVRAREAGRHAWPPLRVEVEDPTGEVTALEVEAPAAEVVSSLGEVPERIAPYGLREPERPAAGLGDLPAALIGAASALLAVAAVALVRRRRARPPAAAPQASDAAPWDRAAEALAEARGALDAGDPQEAAGLASRALRRYATRRFQVPVEARTSEELAALRTPFLWGARWPDLLSLLRELDDVRFRPVGGADDPADARVASSLARAERLVADMRPPRDAR